MGLKFRPGLELKASASNPTVKRWQSWKTKVPKPEMPAPSKLNDIIKLSKPFEEAGRGEVFKKASKSFNAFNESLRDSKHKDVLAEYDKTVIEVPDKRKYKILGISFWPGPHYNFENKTNPAKIIFHPDDMDFEKKGMGKLMGEIAKGDFGTIVIHEAAHAWDFARAKTKGHEGKSYWSSEVHPKIVKQCPVPPQWMRTGMGSMGRVAYAAMVPHEMPSVMTEFAHADHARYHATHELFKEDYGVDLNNHLTEFWGKSIAPPRPNDGSVEKHKEEARKTWKGLRNAVELPLTSMWDSSMRGQLLSYADGGQHMPDHKISYIPWEILKTIYPHCFGSDEGQS